MGDPQRAVVERGCRLCGGILHTILDLGSLKLPWFPKTADHDVPAYPLVLATCDGCALVQLRHTVAPDLLYKRYWYRSGINEAMRLELQSVVQAGLRETSVYPQDLVLDAGANDGYLLSQYQTQRAHFAATRIAIEPAENLHASCAAHCEVLVKDYFPPTYHGKEVHGLRGIAGKVKILTSIAMFYDLDDPRAFAKAVNEVLHEDGVWILQFQDLCQMIEACAIDNICHEHLTYWSLASFMEFLDRTGLDLHITHAERRVINGGSLRIHVRRKAFPVQASVEELREIEAPGIGWQAIDHFGWQAAQMRKQIWSVVQQRYEAGQPIDLYGASTKANTLLQWCALSPTLIRRAWERNPDKVGRFTATGIPIVDEAAGRADPPAVLFVGIWQFRPGVIAREQGFLANGGVLIFPLPEVDLVRNAPV